MKIFLDANIVIDFLDSQRRYHKNVNDFFERAINEGYEIVISEDILTTVYYVCKKSISSKKLFDFFEMLNEEFEVVCFGKKNIQKSVRLCQKNKKLDFEDALQAVCAKNVGCDLIVTNDKNFPNINFPMKTIKEFMV